MAYATKAQLDAETAARIAADNALDARLKVIEPQVADLLKRVAALEKLVLPVAPALHGSPSNKQATLGWT